MELQKTRKPKAKSQGKDTTSVFRAKPPTNAHSVLPPLQLAELESRLEQLPTDFDELPCVSAEPDTPSRVSSVKKNEQDGSTEEDVSRETSSVPKPSEPEGTESKVDEIQSAESRLATHGEESDKTTHNHLCQELEEQLSQAENLHPSIYPTVHPISGESIEKFSGMIRIEPSAGKIYPVLSDPSLNCETQLLSEAQLEAIYHNQLYENTEAFVDIFIESAEFPQDGCISELLRLYKEACCEYDRSSTESVSRENVIKDCIAGVWTAETRTVNQEGKCGDQKFATGSAKYIVASLHKDRLTELGKLFKEDTRGRMDTELSWRIRTRSLAHQLQWQIIRINNAFMFDHRVSANSQPCFIEDGGQLTSRLVLHNALSNLFFHLRFPYLPSQFRESISSWITELCATLMKACTSQDQQFILCHLLRLTSPLDWAPKLLQSFLNVPVANSRIIIDHSLAMLHILLSPVKSRDNFLRRIKEYEKEESSWAIINEDYDEEETSLTVLDESDLCLFLDQFNPDSLLAKAIEHFSFASSGSQNGSNYVSQMLSLIAFELVLLKIYKDGLEEYHKPRYYTFCKQIGMAISRSIRCVSDFWMCIRDSLNDLQQKMLQDEYERMILFAFSYVTGKKGSGLCQFVTGFPFFTLSDTCLRRCRILLLCERELSVYDILKLPENELVKLSSSGKNLSTLISELPSSDSNHLVRVIASLVAPCQNDAEKFLKDLIETCFMEESLRDDYSKVGAEAIGLMIDTSPALFSSVLRIIDRNLDSLEEFAVEILSLAPLAKCRLSEEEVGSICGKWLINRPPDHAGSRIARRILGSMNWGVLEDGQLWLPQNVHEECAETILKGHMTQCKGANSLIAKSWSAVSKLSSKLSEHEAVFDLFCWDVLLRLKLPSKSGHSSPPSDLVAFYLHIIQYSFSSPEFFLSDGLPYLYELISAGCYSAACVIIVRFISDFPLCVDDLVNIDGFLEYFDRLLHFGESSYAYQLIGGTNHFPGPVLRLLESAINYKLSEVCDESHLCAWGKLLCAKKLNEWNGDRNILYLIGVLVPIAFERDQHKIMGLLDCFRSTYASSIQRWKENAKGLLSWLGGDSELPPLIDTSNLGVSPWASFLLLKAEEICLSEFYKEYDVYMAKHMDYGLDQIVKKAGSKSHLPVALKHIRCIRWLDLCCTDGLYTHPVFPLACQHFAFYLFQRTSYFGSKVCRGRRIMSSDVAFMQVEKLQKQILPKAQNESEKEANNVALFYKAFSQWLRTPDIFDVEFRDFNTLLLDEQLQLLLIGDVCPFQFVDLNRLAEERINKKKVYSLTRHIGSFLPRKSYSGPTTITGLVQTVLKKTTYLPFPSLPLHEGLPEEPKIDISTASDPRRCIELCNMEINVINQAARTLLAARDKVEDLNTTYINEFAGLYADALTELSILLKCGNIFGYQCEKPVSVNVSVTASQYQQRRGRYFAPIYFLSPNSAIEAKKRQPISTKVLIWGALPNHLSQKITHGSKSLPPKVPLSKMPRGKAVCYD